MLKTDSKKLETRDFISVGIFSLIYSVVAFVIGGVAQMTPVTFPFMPMIVALFTGTVFMLYVAKIPKKGALSILGVIAAILLFITGMFWMMSVFFLVFGLIADFICASADFRSFKKNLLAYCVMALAPMGAYMIFFQQLKKQTKARQPAVPARRMGEDLRVKYDFSKVLQ